MKALIAGACLILMVGLTACSGARSNRIETLPESPAPRADVPADDGVYLDPDVRATPAR